MIRWCCALWLLLCAGAAFAAGAPTILVLGDSLSAAHGIPMNEGWVALLQRRLTQQGYPHRVINASVSGETTVGGLSRLPQALAQHRPAIVLIELGGNDGLRGLPTQKLRDNLARMVELSRAAGAQAVVFEMCLPPNYGEKYSTSFTRSFGLVATAAKVPLVPFFLAEIAADPASFQPDGIHPSVAVQPRLLDAVWPVIKPLLRPAGGGATAQAAQP